MKFAKFLYRHKILIISLLISFSLQSFSQKYLYLESYNVDSLLLILPGQLGEERVNTLNTLAASYFCYEEFDLSQQYAEDAMNLAKEHDFQEGMAAAYRNFGHINYYRSNYTDALNNLFESLRLYVELDKKHTVADIYYDIAATHYFAGNFEKTLEYGNIALAKFRERLEGGAMVGSVRDTIKVLGGLALTYNRLDINRDTQLEIRLKHLEAGRRHNFGMTEMMLITFLAGTDFYLLGETDSAKVYFEKALAYPNVNPSIEALKYRPISWLGYLHYAAGDVDSAIFYLRKPYDWYNEKGFLYWAMDASRNLGSIYYQNNELNTSENYYQQSERVFKEWLQRNSWYRHDSLKNIVTYGTELYFPIPPSRIKEMMWQQGKFMYYGLYQINAAKKRTGEALKYHIAYSSAKDTLNKLQRIRETIELQIRYESESKDQQIQTLSLENELKESRLHQTRFFLFGSVGFFILILMFGFILFRQNKLKADQQMLVLQQKLFRSQMNPHFIFNSLASIQNFIVRQDSRKANIFLSKFSELVRSILDNSTQEYITFDKEISTIQNYLELQKVRYIEKFDYSIDIDEAIDAESMKIPPMLAQPIIENAIEHGIKHKETKGHISILFKLEGSLVVFKVEDDGIGREAAMDIMFKQNKGHKSLATAITRERIQVLNKRMKNKISMQILDLKNEKNEPAGTRVTFEIPVVFS